MINIKKSFRNFITRGVVSNMVDCDIVVSEFKLQLRYYVHFRTNTLEKSMNTVIPRDIG